MSDSDILSFLTYQNAGGMNTDFTSVKSALKWDPIYYSRTANASYGIGLAAVILNDEAMGYNSKIFFITDSSVSVDSRFLKFAINNKIPIYFFCIGDFNTAALIGYAQLTGGKVYSAKTAAEINQSCNEIGPKTFVGETDTDGDGFTDIEEMSGLIVSSNCKLVNTDYMKADTDDDGLDDNEEVDVELTKVEVPGKQGNPSTFKYYHHMNSDPSKADTDGDGLDDMEDFDPIKPLSNDERNIYDFFNNAEDYEIRYVLENPWIQQLGTLKGIECVKICRKHLVDRDLKKIENEMITAGIMSNPKNGKPIDKIMQFLCGHYGNPSTMLFSEYELYKNNMSFSQLIELSWNVWSNDMKMVAQIWLFNVSSLIQQGWAEWDYSSDYKLSLEQEITLQKATNIIDPIEISDKEMYQLGHHYNSHGKLEMGYASKAEYDKAAREFIYKNQNNPNAIIKQGIWGGKGKLAGTVQRAIIFDNYTAIINVENGQIIDFYIGTELKGLIRLRRLR